jgi:esterase/lipase superfamily enzyme
MFDRRRFLKAAGASLGGLATLGAAGTAAAAVPPYVSTRGHFDDDANLVSGYTATEYETVGGVPGIGGSCVDDLAVFAHGWSKNSDTPEQDAKEKFETAKRELEASGYDGTLVGYSWDNDAGGGIDYGWSEAQSVAQQNGLKLAQFLLDYKYYCGGTVRLLSHSLGAQVLFSSLRYLDGSSYWNDYGYQLRSVHPFGAATDNEVPSYEEGRETYVAVRDQVDHAHNYFNQADDVLQYIYNTFEFDQALGETGIEAGNTPPANYEDVDVEYLVGDDHSAYLTDASDVMVADMY